MKRCVLLIGFLSAGFFAPFSLQAGAPAPLYVKAVKQSVAQDYDAAMESAKSAADPLLIKLVEWFRLTDSKQDTDFRQAERFIKKNPNWPRVYLIRRNAERDILENGTKKELETWFKQYPPVSPAAVLAYADLLLAQKDWEKAVPMLHSLWDKGDLSAEDTALVMEKLTFLLDERDFQNRIRKLLNDRKPAQARKFFPFIGEDERRLAQTRTDLITNSPQAKKELKELPPSQQKDADLLFDQVRWLRINKKYSSAAKLLEKIPAEKQNASRWWTEKSALIRQFLSEEDYQSAYDLAKNHHLTEGSADFADAEWTAGWIALRNLKKKKNAVEHFKKMLGSVSSPLSVARGEYWLGRTYEEMNKAAQAEAYYKNAAKKHTTIYGQLASEKLNKKNSVSFPLSDRKEPAPQLIDKLKKSDMYNAMKVLENAEQHETAELFATRLFLNASSAEEITALAYLVATDLKREDMAVTIARRARQNGIDIASLGYPVWDLKHDERTETALILSIIRQESSFSPYAVSSAGARGLMQIMPATAKQVARKKRKAFSVHELNSNPDFNVELGSTYFADLLKRFNGSYILAIAAYNAGPTNVNKWLKSIGNPQENMDPIDWIERIPFNETRNYVQRVLENLHIYRRYLNYPETELSNWVQKEAEN
ncbi:MAG: lytic transglycosylase domain-containing protein [Alphaproteobacteria bacterium]|nr:lytic transglycosylase domain-containing protein [Alphaproteobacteria bacterium]